MSINSIDHSPVRRRAARSALLVSGVVAALLAASTGAQAQSGATGVEVRPFVGAYIPTGDQRDLLKDAVLVGGQLSWAFIPQLAVTGSFGWAPSKDRITAGDQTLDIYQYDLGAELRGTQWRSALGFTPFVGLGLGGRTYDYRDLDVGSKTNVAGYGALGGDIGFGRVGLRLEARDYLSRFEPLTGGGDIKTRNDIGLTMGVAYHF